MKKLCWALTLIFPLLLKAQSPAHSLSKLWETDTVVAIPESVIQDPVKRTLYVSLIDGGPWDADGKGGVAKLSLDGKHYTPDWITGLNAPKGLGRYGNHLYVADISNVVVIDITKGAIEKKIDIAGANGLNDITVDGNGIVYVSDSKAGKVYRIEKDIPKLYMDSLPGANGLKATKTGLYILARKAVLLADAGKNIKTITTLPNGGDGVEEVGNGDLIVSEWVGYIYYVTANGEKQLLMDTHLQHKNTADIMYDPLTHTLFIPSFNGKTIAAYRLVNDGATKITPKATSLLWDPQRLDSWHQKAAAGDTAARQLITRVCDKADHLLAMQPLSVMDKTFTPPSGTKHDYMSQAPYFWYDSSKPNGLPYVRHDGRRNPEINRITDHHNIGELGNAVQTLTLAWVCSKQERYAQKATELLRHWFLDEATRMNPNLEYGQGIPGINTGRGIGIIETIPLIGIADAAITLQGSAAWTKADANGLRSWYAQYLDWMLASNNGQEEHRAANNHGSWFLAQATAYALYTGDAAEARALAEEGKAKMDHQIEADGKMPEELARTNGLGYSTYNLQALFTLARLAGHTGVDLWQYKDQQQATLRTAFDWLIPYALDQKKWEYQQISPYNKDELYALLLQAYPVYSDTKYLTDAHLIHSSGGNPVTDLTWGL
jgi:hypothetical protein